MADYADVGTGASIAFGTSSFSAEILNITGGDISREDIPTSHLLTTIAHTFMPSDLYDPGTLDFEIHLNPDTTWQTTHRPPFDAVAETITITFPVPSGGATGATLAASGYIKVWGWGNPLEDKMTANITVKFSGALTFSNSA